MEGCVIHRSMLLIPAAPLNLLNLLSSQQDAVSWTLFFRCDWHPSFTCNVFTVTIDSFTVAKFLEHTALSTTNKRKRTQMTFLSLIAGTSTTAHPNPSTKKTCPEGFAFFKFIYLL